ncbi:flavin-containing amine oxidoreductase-domain containing protein [Tuber brumale]|nr:flavin-containing amine oxidoreductase-domain containing protein [Tuber brumale]
MTKTILFWILLTSATSITASPAPHSSTHPIGLEVRTAIDTGVANVHLIRRSPVSGGVVYTYGSCSSFSSQDCHHFVSSTPLGTDADRLLWKVPEDAPPDGCISAWGMNGGGLLGRSLPLDVRAGLKRRNLARREINPIEMDNSSGIDTSGPWFDGVKLLKDKEVPPIVIEELKKKKIGILGAGISGLMTGLLLDSQGFHNWEITEASQRLGGRIHTEYFAGGPTTDDYQYQEMGPMRFPRSIKYAETNESLIIRDHHIVFQLADYLNNKNKNDANLVVKFIRWIQTNPNARSYFQGIRKPDGSVPTLAEAQADPSLSPAPITDPSYKEVEEQLFNLFMTKEKMAELANNVYKAHKKAIDEGWDDFSEFEYIHTLLGASLNVTDLAITSPESIADSFWDNYFDNVYFSATDWVTIDHGLNRLPLAFGPTVKDRVKFGRRVDKIGYSKSANKVEFSWRKDFRDRDYLTAEYDYALVAAPFSIVRKLRTPVFSSVLGRAIGRLGYTNACKTAVQFKTRFWEHLNPPIFGGCTATDIPLIQTYCYPSYNLNGTGPGVLLASYNFGATADRSISFTDDEHIEHVMAAMEEIHGPVVRQQFMRAERKCWILDGFEAGSWAAPLIGQHKLYIPSYFNVENNIIFIGEHTSYTHGWIASALESAVRGTVQLFLEWGLVDEAKNITETWMGRWITV